MHSEVESQIAAVMFTANDSFSPYLPLIEQQDNSVDCGLYVIANATEFAYKRQIDRSQLRSHWLKCVEKQEVSPFPRTEERNLQKEDMEIIVTKVHCVCRLPEHYSKVMIECDGVCGVFFHPTCVVLDKIPKGICKCDICSTH